MRALAAAGYVAKATVYAVMGALSLSLALGAGGRTTDSRGAIATVADAPAGRVLVALLAAGLVALAVWLVFDAVADTLGRRRSGAWAMASRVGQGLSAIGYASLAFAAVRLALLQGAGPGGDEAARTWTARALALPGGRALVFAGAGVALFIAGRQIWIAVGRRFEEQLDLGRMGAFLRAWAARLGTFGFVAQGTVIGLVGAFFAQAAFEGQPHEATGFDGALQAIARQPLGMALLGATALGFLAYAAFAVIEGTHRRLGRP